ncbi:MAG: hypothetical protein ACKVWR_13015, partial [Acidimicrobiales bacterium]
EYFTAAVRRDRPEAVQAVFAELTRFFEALLAAAGAPPARAHGLISYLVGTIMQQTVRPLAFAEIEAEIAAIVGLPQPPAALALGWRGASATS